MAKKITIAILLVVCAGFFIGFLYFFNLYLGKKDVIKSAGLIQDRLAEAWATKLIGDRLDAKTKDLPADYTWQNVESRAENLANLLPSLDTSDRLADYKKNATIWIVKIREAAKDSKTWADIPAEPGDFDIQLREKEAAELVQDATVRLGEIRQFGDFAVSKNDRESMRYIAAKLLVQNHWLQGLSRHTEPSIWARLATPAYAYAVEGKQVCFTTWNGKPLCSPEVIEMTTEMYNAAQAVYNDQENSAETWHQASANIHAELEAHGVPIETLGGVGNLEDKNQVQEPLLLTHFKNNCLGRGGLIGGADQSVGYIPTTERGTYCGYKDGVNDCWNYMTNSGGYYSGGDVGCERIGITAEELNFVVGGTIQNLNPPAAPAPTPEPVQPKPLAQPPAPGAGYEPSADAPEVPTINVPPVAPEAGVSQDNSHPYDGYYYVSETYTCNLTDGSSRSINTGYSITVKDGVATTNLDWGNNSAAISGNSAQITGQSSDSYYRYNYTINLNFSQSPNGTWVSGTRNWSQTWIGYGDGLSGNCHGSFEGSGN